MNKKILSLLSLCQKANFLISGEQNCENALRNSVPELVIITEDASDNTKKKFVNKAFYYNVKCIIYGDRELINNAIGKLNRTIFVVSNKKFAEKIMELIKL